MVKTAAILRSRAFLAIASGYLFAACIVIPWMLTFPGVFTPGGLLGAGLQSTNSLYIQWHAGFPGFVIAYALLKDARSGQAIVVGFRGCSHPFECCHDRGHRVCSDIACHSGGCAAAPAHTRCGSSFRPRGLCWRLSSPVERPCTHCALHYFDSVFR
jgi:hypothetical protein